MAAKRNRQSRKTAEVYRVKALFANEAGEAIKNAELRKVDGAEWIVEGALDKFVIASVPPSVSMRLAEGVRQSLVDQLQRPVLMITHNISLLTAERLTPNETAVWLHKMEKLEAERQAREAQRMAAEIAAQSVEAQNDVGHGRGSGLRVDGFGAVAPTGGNGAGGNSDVAGGANGPSNEESEAGSSSLC